MALTGPEPSDATVAAPSAGSLWPQQDSCRYCGRTMGTFGLPRHESRCIENPDRSDDAEEKAKRHKDEDYTRCPRCDKSMLKESLDGHLLANCVIVQYERRHNLTLPDNTLRVGFLDTFNEELASVQSDGSEVTDADLYEVLDLLAPNGIKPRQIPLVNEWLATTKRLLAELRAS